MLFALPAEGEPVKRDNIVRVKGGKKCDLCHCLVGTSNQYRSEGNKGWQIVYHQETDLFDWPYGDFIKTEIRLDSHNGLQREDEVKSPKHVCSRCLLKYKYLQKGILRK